MTLKRGRRPADGRIRLAALMLSVCAAAAPIAARAQGVSSAPGTITRTTVDPDGTVSSETRSTADQAQPPLDAMRVCLCLDRLIQAKSVAVEAARDAYDSAKGAADADQAELDRQRPLIDVANQPQVDAFKARLAELDAARDRLQSALFPPYHDAVADYNLNVAAYTQQCADQRFAPAAIAAAAQTLACPEQ